MDGDMTPRDAARLIVTGIILSLMLALIGLAWGSSSLPVLDEPHWRPAMDGEIREAD